MAVPAEKERPSHSREFLVFVSGKGSVHDHVLYFGVLRSALGARNLRVGVAHVRVRKIGSCILHLAFTLGFWTPMNRCVAPRTAARRKNIL